EPACWIPILKADKVVLAGDPCQLPPTIKSLKAAKEGLAVSLMETCLASGQSAGLLQTQYRMHVTIMEFSNRYFYKKQLHAHESVACHTLGFLENYLTIPLEFIDTAGTGFQEEEPEESSSLENKGERELLEKHLTGLLNDPGYNSHISIGIISPYKAQVLALQEDFRHHPLAGGCDLSINTVDAFQGQERDVIYISLVRSNPEGTIGFLSDLRRMNVAMTRARKKLVIVGDSATLTQHQFYQDLFDYAEEVGGYRSAFELLY
ncbi:MAG: hypothetical protein JXJ04_03035, partial [Spirochaetales bacterium]|nr:hypothetical protein [Spirochaetales bacterium]